MRKNVGSVLALGGAAIGTAALACVGASVVASTRYRKNRSAARLRGKVVLITGSSRGLGLALAEEFGRHGARLVLTARDASELERARTLLITREAVQDPSDILIVPCDLRDQQQCEHLIETATEHYGHIDILVNNAGIITVGPIENQSVEIFRDVMDTNFFAIIQCTLAALPQMLARKSGSIVNITSIGGKVAVPHLLPYTASKFAATGFSEGLHAELRSKGVRVTTVCPGLMRTGSYLRAFFTGDAEREYQWFSLGAALPGVAAAASTAARKIVRATLAGTAEITITPQAFLAARLNHISPEITLLCLRLANALLPSPSARTAAPEEGTQVRSLEVKSATTLGRQAARRYNQVRPAS